MAAGPSSDTLCRYESSINLLSKLSAKKLKNLFLKPFWTVSLINGHVVSHIFCALTGLEKLINSRGGRGETADRRADRVLWIKSTVNWGGWDRRSVSSKPREWMKNFGTLEAALSECQTSVRAHTREEVITEKNLKWNSSCCRVSGNVCLWRGMAEDLGEQLCWFEPSRSFVMSGEDRDSQKTAHNSLLSDGGFHSYISLYQNTRRSCLGECTRSSLQTLVSLNLASTCCVRFARVTLWNWYRKGDGNNEGSQPKCPWRFTWKYQRN